MYSIQESQNMIIFIQIFLSLAAIGLCSSRLLTNVFNRNKYVNYENFFLILLIVDVFLPAFIGAITGIYQKFPYFTIQNESSYLIATIIFIIGTILFALGFKSADYISIKQLKPNPNQEYVISETFLLLSFLFVVAVMVINLLIEFISLGSWDLFYQYKISRIYLATIEHTTFFAKSIALASELTLIILFITMSVGLVNSERLKRPFFWGIVVPVLAFILTLTTMYRGTILQYGIVLILSLQYKYDWQLVKKLRGRIVRIGLLFILAFVVYGAVRTSLNYSYWGEEKLGFIDSFVTMLTNTMGTSLIACARCVEYLNSGNSLFWGESIFQMFYSFIPKSIWADKPTQYGIITLTTAMDSPNTTMDAITMPGELLLNFDYWGLLLLIPIGLVFGLLEQMRLSNRFRYLYIASLSALVTTSMWMSFTGFFAQTKYFFIYAIVLVFIFRKKRYPS
ncbi:TPA: oligosaccharide repeat unit polymerase [Streptococcus suis]|nr:oligosaccharide repeat unit polymerase [Streptococcus suis]HEM4568060.1 oligosaccharide repeat unit polymerase [Streptococcus suis]